MSSTELRHKRVRLLHKRWRPNQKRKAQAREARERRETVTTAALAYLAECGIIGGMHD